MPKNKEKVHDEVKDEFKTMMVQEENELDEQRFLAYLEKTSEPERFKDEGKKTTVLVPYNSFGVDEIQTYELPELPERHRDFAFRWATECRTDRAWAQVFHVSMSTICNWKRIPKIRTYRTLVRKKWETALFERMKLLEDKAYRKLDEILSTPVTDSNMESIRKTICDVLNIKKGDLPRSTEGNKTTLILNQQNNIEQDQTVISLSNIKERTAELELLEDVMQGRVIVEKMEEESK